MVLPMVSNSSGFDPTANRAINIDHHLRRSDNERATQFGQQGLQIGIVHKVIGVKIAQAKEHRIGNIVRAV